ncbi:TolC family protein [bacterium]|nr:TolC family protein [bacterium]
MRRFKRILLLLSYLAVLPNPLSLDEAVKIALQNNKQIRVSEEKLLSARSNLDMVKAGEKIHTSLSASAVRMDKKTTITMPSFIPGSHPIEITVGELYSYKASLGIIYPIDVSKKLSLSEKLARMAMEQAEIDLKRTKEDVITSTKKAFFQALQAKKSIAVFEATLKTAEEALRVAKANYEAGTVPHFDVLRAEVNLANIRQSLLTVQNAYEMAKSALLNTMGIDPTMPIELQEEIPEADFQLLPLEEYVKKALQNRKEIAVLKLGIEIAEENLALTKRENYPDLSLGFLYNWQHPTTSFNPRETYWNMVLSLSFTPFDSGLNKAKQKNVIATIETLKANLAQLEDGVRLEVKNAYTSLENARAKLEVAQKVLEQAREAYRLAQARYEAGVSTQVELLDTQSALTQAEVNYVNALFDFHIAKINLDKAIGEIKEER